MTNDNEDVFAADDDDKQYRIDLSCVEYRAGDIMRRDIIDNPQTCICDECGKRIV